jgi:hypothetical protein
VTTSIPLEDLPAAALADARRDRWGRYLVVPPDGGAPQGYTRITTVAKALDTGGGLASWKAAMTAQGLILRKGLRAQWEALMAAHNGDPWYSGEESKAEAKRLVEECAAVGGANDRRDMGSALHTMTALVDLGRAPGQISEETQADLLAYADGLEEAKITICDGAIEVVVVLDEYQVAGTFDRVVVVDRPGFGLPVVADLKTGASLEYSYQAIAVQLAAYAHADARYEQGAAQDGSEDRRLPMIPVDQDWALILWLPAGKAKLEIIAVDIQAGWTAFKSSMWARKWRANRSLTVPLSDLYPRDDAAAALEASIGQRYAGRSVTEIRGWLQKRIDLIGAHGQARTALAERWAGLGVPTLKASSCHTPSQFFVIERLLDDIEGIYRMPFGDPMPQQGKEQDPVLSLFKPNDNQTKDNDK